MARHYSTQEALDIIMHSDCEDGSSSSSVDSEADTEEASESTEDASERFHQISRTLRFDDKLSRPRRRDDKLAAFRKVWDMWTHRLPMLFSPFSDVCVDEQLVPFRGMRMLVTPHIKKRGRLTRSSAAATMMSDLQGAAAGPSLISERKSRRQCHFCMDRRVCSTCCKCGKFICKDHSLSICSPCST
ncbi:hypothetical protein JOQ06_005684 [Pogonophryne albipinna]|uniref:PiggyBac transposable element-derived protein domain-containing protein n=1 Tax=Pogonophryne albipinna TaxID=1090488 RepID=A0AAD6FRW6_9TELE|nr:hypothetical protein JOQ06_005684 [Pogonophryne albipinna]